MIEVIVVVAVAGLVLLFWPAGPKAAASLAATLAPPPPAAPANPQTHQGALMALSAVRARLLATNQLDEASKSSVAQLTAALVEGADK